MTIKGFNVPKTVKTKLVELNVELASKSYKFAAVCVPDLSAKPSTRRISQIANELKNKGFKLADSYILNNPEKMLDMVLGVDSFHSLDIRTISFGPEKNSCYFQSRVGIMPIGNSERLLENIQCTQEFNQNLIQNNATSIFLVSDSSLKNELRNESTEQIVSKYKFR